MTCSTCVTFTKPTVGHAWIHRPSTFQLPGISSSSVIWSVLTKLCGLPGAPRWLRCLIGASVGPFGEGHRFVSLRTLHEEPASLFNFTGMKATRSTRVDRGAIPCDWQAYSLRSRGGLWRKAAAQRQEVRDRGFGAKCRPGYTNGNAEADLRPAYTTAPDEAVMFRSFPQKGAETLVVGFQVVGDVTVSVK
ncbi:hypothetical protein VTK26DRAFT_8157 [Humicola hyalothermophila]